MAVRAEVDRAQAGIDRLHLAGHLAAVAVEDPHARELNVDDVAFLEIDDLIGRAGERHRVRGQEVLTLAEPDDQRRSCPGPDDAMRLVAAEHRDRVCAAQLAHRRLHGRQKIAVIVTVDQMRDDFGVGLAFKNVAELLQTPAQFLEILDDAVVHQGDSRAARCLVEAAASLHWAGRKVRVRVGRAGRAMRGPARVRDAGKRCKVIGLAIEFSDTRHAARPLQPAVGMYRDTARVITAVFQPTQSFDQDRDDVAP